MSFNSTSKLISRCVRYFFLYPSDPYLLLTAFSTFQSSWCFRSVTMPVIPTTYSLTCFALITGTMSFFVPNPQRIQFFLYAFLRELCPLACAFLNLLLIFNAFFYRHLKFTLNFLHCNQHSHMDLCMCLELSFY